MIFSDDLNSTSLDAFYNEILDNITRVSKCEKDEIIICAESPKRTVDFQFGFLVNDLEYIYNLQGYQHSDFPTLTDIFFEPQLPPTTTALATTTKATTTKTPPLTTTKTEAKPIISPSTNANSSLIILLIILIIIAVILVIVVLIMFLRKEEKKLEGNQLEMQEKTKKNIKIVRCC